MIPTSLIAAASFTPNSLSPPDPWMGHLPFAAWVIREVSPQIFVELGTHSGNSYFTFCQSVAEANIPSKCYAVDTWLGDEQAGQYSEEIFTQVNAHNQKNYARFSRLLRMTFDDAATYFGDKSIELLHIDGLHTYEAVRHDFDTWLPKLALGAVVMFHDTNVRERNFGVWKLWEELQARYPNNLEFTHSHGLGVFQLNNAPNENRLHWLQPDFHEKQVLINYFATLGARQLERFELNRSKVHAAGLNHAVAERDGQVANISQALVERDRQISTLVGERDGQIVHLNQVVAERDGQIASLTQMLVERDGEISTLVGERDGQLAHLNQALAERDGQIASLKEVVEGRDRQVSTWAASRSWQLTKPLRFVRRLIRGEFGLARAQLLRPRRRFADAIALCRAIPRAVSFYNGSPKLAFHRVLSVMMREGFSGVTRRANILMRGAVSGYRQQPPPLVAFDDSSLPHKSKQNLCSISVVIPTCNRGELLSQTLDRCLECAEGMEVEFIVIDDGSTDDTPRRLADLSLKVPNLQWRSIVKGGPSMARNLGAAIARHDILLFMGDDIQPVDSDFFRTHGALHSANPSNDIAILGKIIWPNSNKGFVNFVMSHIQGHGGEQFGYADLVPYTNLDWRFFYTANVSIKRAIVEDWRAEGFDSDFKQAAWEDVEFAYRLKKKSGSFRIFYDPTSVATHYHRYSAAGFIERQMSVGSMAQVFFGKHPDAAQVLGFDAIIQILSSPGSTDSPDLTAEYHSIIEGLKSFVRLMDEIGALGTQPWHDALLAGVFDLAVFQGFVLSWAELNGNHAAALEYSLRRFRQAMRREAHINFGLHM